MALDQAYAQAMETLAQKYPEDDDAQAIFAEAMMNTMPWDYWLDGDNPKANTRKVIDVLETVMARNPRHPLTLHLYIHAVEASSKPGGPGAGFWTSGAHAVPYLLAHWPLLRRI